MKSKVTKTKKTTSSKAVSKAKPKMQKGGSKPGSMTKSKTAIAITDANNALKDPNVKNTKFGKMLEDAIKNNPSSDTLYFPPQGRGLVYGNKSKKAVYKKGGSKKKC